MMKISDICQYIASRPTYKCMVTFENPCGSKMSVIIDIVFLYFVKLSPLCGLRFLFSDAFILVVRKHIRNERCREIHPITHAQLVRACALTVMLSGMQ